MVKLSERNAKQQLLLSSLLAIISFAVNVIIGFWSSPFIVSKIGTEAHGFSSLGTNMTTYMGLVVAAINSFAARYISIAIQQKDYEKANQYFTSVFYANLTISVALLLPMILLVAYVNRIFEIPDYLVNDVRLQWTIMLVSWIAELIIKVFSTATFVKNRLDLDHGLSLISHSVRFISLFTLYNIFTPKLWFIGVSSLLASSFPYFGHIFVKKKIMPEVKINIEYLNFGCIRELANKGVWNSINSLAGMLMNGFDLVIANLAVSSVAMGLYSIAQTIPNYIQSLMYTLCNQVTPNLTILYAQGKNKEVRDGLIFGMKFNSVILMVPLCGFFIFGYDFYTLWQYSLGADDIKEIYILSSLVILPMISSIVVQPLLSANTITAKLKIPVLINTVMGVSNIIIELIFVKTTSLGVYAIAGVSSVLLLIRNYAFYPIYSAKILDLPIKSFYPTIVKGTICFTIISAFIYFTHSLVIINSWVTLLFYAFLFGVVAQVIVFLIMLGKEEKKKIIGLVHQKLHSKKKWLI